MKDLKQALRDLRESQKRLRESQEGLRERQERLLEAYYASDCWAHELEDMAREQQAAILAYRRVMAPMFPLVRLTRALKNWFAQRKAND